TRNAGVCIVRTGDCLAVTIKALISEKLALTVFDEETVRRKLSHILVKSNNQIDIAYFRGLALHL
ncbi:MAG: hypothetical protein RSA80_10080, partial [Lachnospiraceae bacterium]